MKSFFIRTPPRILSVVTVLIISLLVGLITFNQWDELELSAIPNQPKEAPKGQILISIKIPSRTLELYENNKLYKQYRIAAGKSETPSPVGEWVVIWKSYRDGDIFGTRFLALNVPWGALFLVYDN